MNNSFIQITIFAIRRSIQGIKLHVTIENVVKRIKDEVIKPGS